MSSRSNVLAFPPRPARSWLSPREAEGAARDYFAVPAAERGEEHNALFLSSPDILLAICSVLGNQRDTAPAFVETEAAAIHKWISRPSCDLGLFDEKDYFLGQTALLAGIAARHTGHREEAFLWLDRAESGFRHTMNPAPGLANVAYARLTVRFEIGRYQDVLELSPSLESSFIKLGMPAEAAKCRLLTASTLKLAGRHTDAIELLDSLSQSPTLRADSPLRAQVLAELGDLRQLEGQLELALAAFKEASTLLQNMDLSPVKATVKMYLGGVYKSLGRFDEAISAFRASQEEFAGLAMRPYVAYLHLVIAETLLEEKRDRQAEWEILAALPAIEEMKMVPEAFAAVALLRESVARQKTDPAALQKLRTYIQT